MTLQRKCRHSPAREGGGFITDFPDVPDILPYGQFFPLLSLKPAVFWFPLKFFFTSIWSWWNSLYKLFMIKFQNICPRLWNGPGRNNSSCSSQGVQSREDGDEIHDIPRKPDSTKPSFPVSHTRILYFSQALAPALFRVCIPQWLRTHSNRVGGQSVTAFI